MRSVQVTASRNYEVHIGSGLLPSIADHVAAMKKVRSVCIVSDTNVWPLYGKTVENALIQRKLNIVSFVFEAGEASKNPETYLDPVHHCSLCNDEGAVDGQLCPCYKQALSEQYLAQSGMQHLFAGCSFSAYDLSLYPAEGPDGLSPREKMKKMLDFAKKYVKTFGEDSQNLLFVGEPGCGKTYLSVCIGCELIRSGKFVLYAPVQDLLSDFEAATFRNKEATMPTGDLGMS